VADATNDREFDGRQRARQRFLVECPEVLQRTAAPDEQQDIDFQIFGESASVGIASASLVFRF